MLDLIMTLNFFVAFMIGILLCIMLIIVLPIKLILSLFVKKKKISSLYEGSITQKQFSTNISPGVDHSTLTPITVSSPERRLKVPYIEKDEAKRLGARFDGTNKVWYVPDHLWMQNFSKWWPIPANLTNITESIKITSGEFICIDLETTGLDPGKDRIIEIAAVKYKNYILVDKWVSLINPKKPIPPEATKIHGITDEVVAFAPSIENFLPDFLQFLGSDILIGHNCLFDLRFLDYDAKKLGFTFDVKYIDTLHLSRKLFPKSPNHKLPTLVKYLNINITESHRALGDAKACAEVFLSCMLKLNQMSPELLRKKYINVPTEDVVEAEECGALFDSEKQLWYVPPDLMLGDFGDWYEISQECGQALCSECGNFALHFLDIEIRNNYQCFKCKSPMKIISIFFLPEDDLTSICGKRHPLCSAMHTSKPLSLISFSQKFDITLENRYSHEAEAIYPMHICPKCNAHQGDHYIMLNLYNDSFIEKSFHVSYCASCDKWEIIEEFA